MLCGPLMNRVRTIKTIAGDVLVFDSNLMLSFQASVTLLPARVKFTTLDFICHDTKSPLDFICHACSGIIPHVCTHARTHARTHTGSSHTN